MKSELLYRLTLRTYQNWKIYIFCQTAATNSGFLLILWCYSVWLRLTLIKAAVPNSISEEDLVSAEAQQDCRPQISIHFSPPRAFDFVLDPWLFTASCKTRKSPRTPSQRSVERLWVQCKTPSTFGTLTVDDSIWSQTKSIRGMLS